MSFINNIDYRVAEFFHKMYLWGGEFTNAIMKIISFVGEYGALFLLIGFGLALFKRTRKVGATIILSIAIGFVISNLLLKNIAQRVRPFKANSEFELWWAGANGKNESGYSFPSGHVTAATAFALAVCMSTNKKYNWPIMFLPILMASSRIYLVVHYFTDCLGGIAVGSVSAIVAYFIIRGIYKSKYKIFVWFRELDLFKPKDKKKPEPIRVEPDIKQPEQPFVYVPQSEEVDSSLIQQTIHESKEQPKDSNN